MEVGGQRHGQAALPPRKGPGTHCVGGLVDHRVGMYECGKSRPLPRFDPRTVEFDIPTAYDPSSPLTLSRLMTYIYIYVVPHS